MLLIGSALVAAAKVEQLVHLLIELACVQMVGSMYRSWSSSRLRQAKSHKTNLDFYTLPSVSGTAAHIEIWKNYQSISRVLIEVLQHL